MTVQVGPDTRSSYCNLLQTYTTWYRKEGWDPFQQDFGKHIRIISNWMLRLHLLTDLYITVNRNAKSTTILVSKIQKLLHETLRPAVTSKQPHAPAEQKPLRITAPHTTAALNITPFWDMTPCRLVNMYRRFGAACFLRFQCHIIWTSSTQKMDAASSAEKLLTIYQSPQSNIPEDLIITY